MWLFYAAITALLLAGDVLFARTSLKRTDFEIVSAIKTLVILLFCWYSVFANKVQKQIASVSYDLIIDILIMGVLICGGMLAYHLTLKSGNVTKATAFQKISSALILLSGIVVFNQKADLLLRILGIAFIFAGAIIMLTGKGKSSKAAWIAPGMITSLIICFAYTFARKEIIGKINVYIALALMLTAALLISLIAVFIRGISSGIGRVPASEIIYSTLSGILFCLALASANKALSLNGAAVCHAVMHLGSVFAVIGSSLFFKEKMSWKTACGLLTIVCGIVIVVFLVGVYNF